MPKRVCVKVEYLRPRYDNLAEWMAVPGHVLTCRRGRVFITRGEEKYVFPYPASEWANPFTVKEHGVEQCLRLYEQHLVALLKDEAVRQRFRALLDSEELGCFCEPNSACHVDVILKQLAKI